MRAAVGAIVEQGRLARFRRRCRRTVSAHPFLASLGQLLRRADCGSVRPAASGNPVPRGISIRSGCRGMPAPRLEAVGAVIRKRETCFAPEARANWQELSRPGEADASIFLVFTLAKQRQSQRDMAVEKRESPEFRVFRGVRAFLGASESGRDIFAARRTHPFAVEADAVASGGRSVGRKPRGRLFGSCA